MNQPIAIQSWCFRHFKSLTGCLEQLKATGATATELCGVHASFNDATTYANTVDTAKKAGVKLVCIGVEYLSTEIEKDRHKFEFCKAAGIRHMSISFQPAAMFDGLRNIEKLADEYDMLLSIHNHGGHDWLGNPTMLKYIFANTSKRIGLHLDTAWALDAGQNPVEMAKTFADRLYGVHIKDFTFDRAKKPTDVVIGTGNLDLPGLLTTLRQINFAGPLVIEYEGDVENPTPALKQCVDLVKKHLA